MKSKKRYNEKKMNCVEDSMEDSECHSVEDIYTYMHETKGPAKERKKKWFVTLRLHGKAQRCQLDSVATCDVMSYKTKMRLAPKAPLRPSKAVLRPYSGESLSSIGLFDTDCVVRGQKYRLTFEIVNTNRHPLLSGG